MNWTLGGGCQPASDRVNDFGCQQRVGLSFARNALTVQCRVAARTLKKLEILNIPKLPGVMFRDPMPDEPGDSGEQIRWHRFATGPQTRSRCGFEIPLNTLRVYGTSGDASKSAP